MLQALGVASMAQAAWPLVSHLHRLGVAAAEEWLLHHGPHLGRHSTVVLEELP